MKSRNEAKEMGKKNDPWKIYYYSYTIKTNEIKMRMAFQDIEGCRILYEISELMLIVSS